MNNNQERILAKSAFDSAACHKLALIFYVCYFIGGGLLGGIFAIGSGVRGGLVAVTFIVAGLLLAAFFGGPIHAILYFTSKNNEITLTNYKVIGTYRRNTSLNIPIDSISSVSKGTMGTLYITCPGNRYNMSFVDNRDDFCAKLNELLNQRTQQTLRDSAIDYSKQSNFDEIAKLKQLLDNGAITKEEFDAKKKQLLGL